MKKILTLTIIFLSAFIFIRSEARAPMAMFSYEGIARGNRGVPVANSSITMTVSVIDGNEDGRVLYEEVQSINTNSIGLFNTSIGRGVVVNGSIANFANSNNKFIKIKLQSIGESQGRVQFECIKCRYNGRQM